MRYVSRAGEKLEYALETFGISVEDLVCADFGSNKGGFVDCLLTHGARKVYAVETGYGILDWKLRKDERVVVMERTNAMHVVLPEKVDLMTIDTSWTRLEKVLPSALRNLKEGGSIVALVKPHYQSSTKVLRDGKINDTLIPEVLHDVRKKIREFGLDIVAETESPIVGEKAKNREFCYI